jgi:hypothetical protein
VKLILLKLKKNLLQEEEEEQTAHIKKSPDALFSFRRILYCTGGHNDYNSYLSR